MDYMKKNLKIIDPMKSQDKYSSIQVFKYSNIELTNWLLPITHYIQCKV